MTFLEYTINRLDTWLCPWCRRAELTTRPPHAKFKDRFDCECCGKWGDVADIAAKCWPGVDYETRRQRLENWRVDYDFSQKRGQGELEADVEQSFHELVELLRHQPARWGHNRIMNGLRAVVWAVAIVDEHRDVTLNALAGRAAQFLIDRKEQADSWRSKRTKEYRALEKYLADPENPTRETMEILDGVDITNRIDKILEEAKKGTDIDEIEEIK